MKKYLSLFFLLNLCAILFFLPGCVLSGYQAFKPTSVTPYDSMFSDLITTFDQPDWLWIHGVTTGNFTGSGSGTDEAIVAAVHSGTRSNPGPIKQVFLLICQTTSDNQRIPVARMIIFDKNPIANTPKPNGAIVPNIIEDLYSIRAQTLSDRSHGPDTVILYTYGNSKPTTVWYGGYILEGGLLKQVLSTTAWQKNPGIFLFDLNKKFGTDKRGKQLVIHQDVLSTELLNKLAISTTTPIWGNIYARNDDGNFVQSDLEFGKHYERLQTTWYKAYAQAQLISLPQDDMFYLYYYLSELNFFIGDLDLAELFVQKSFKSSASNPELLLYSKNLQDKIASRQGK